MFVEFTKGRRGDPVARMEDGSLGLVDRRCPIADAPRPGEWWECEVAGRSKDGRLTFLRPIRRTSFHEVLADRIKTRIRSWVGNDPDRMRMIEVLRWDVEPPEYLVPGALEDLFEEFSKDPDSFRAREEKAIARKKWRQAANEAVLSAMRNFSATQPGRWRVVENESHFRLEPIRKYPDHLRPGDFRVDFDRDRIWFAVEVYRWVESGPEGGFYAHGTDFESGGASLDWVRVADLAQAPPEAQRAVGEFEAVIPPRP